MNALESASPASARGRPRSEVAREAVLHAADDLLVELGYEALTMKGIAERAGVGRQTVYRWWTSKAEVLFEACVTDATRELVVDHADDGDADATVDAATVLQHYVLRLHAFLTASDAGATYLALLGAAQVDRAVAAQLRAADPLRTTATALIEKLRPGSPGIPSTELAVAQLVGPLVFQALSVSEPMSRAFADDHYRAIRSLWAHR